MGRDTLTQFCLDFLGANVAETSRMSVAAHDLQRRSLAFNSPPTSCLPSCLCFCALVLRNIYTHVSSNLIPFRNILVPCACAATTLRLNWRKPTTHANLCLTAPEACGKKGWRRAYILPGDWFSHDCRSVLTTRQAIVSLFLGRFTLDKEEKEALTSRDVPVDKRFFRAMDKAEKIRDDCRVLMTGEDGPTPAGCVS